GDLTTIAFDKTGTLTEGKPRLTHAEPLNGFDKDTFLEMVLDVESQSNHPLAKGISKDIIAGHGIENKQASSNIKALQGMGIQALYENGPIYIGNVKLMEQAGIAVPSAILGEMDQLLQKGNTVMLVAYKNSLIGMLGVMDLPRQYAAAT